MSLDKRLFGKATIYDCVLAQEWARSSGPWPPPPRRPPSPVDPAQAARVAKRYDKG